MGTDAGFRGARLYKPRGAKGGQGRAGGDDCPREGCASGMAAKTVLITGCSSGLGKAAAERFCAVGWNVAATMRDVDCAAAREFANSPGVLVVPLDVMDGVSVASGVAAAIARFGGVDVLVNNAGVGVLGPLESVAPDALEWQFAINVLGPVRVMQALLPHFRARRAGLIVNVSSVLGRACLPLMSVYQGSKAALESMSETAAMELAPLGVRVKLLEPGGIRTSFFQRGIEGVKMDGQYAGMSRSWREVMQRNAAESFSTVEDVVDVLWKAVTDGEDRLRYVAGEDAESLLQMRKELDDEMYGAAMSRTFGILGEEEGAEATRKAESGNKQGLNDRQE